MIVTNETGNKEKEDHLKYKTEDVDSEGEAIFHYHLQEEEPDYDEMFVRIGFVGNPLEEVKQEGKDIDWYMNLNEVKISDLCSNQVADLKNCITTHLERGNDHDEIMFIINFYFE